MKYLNVVRGPRRVAFPSLFDTSWDSMFNDLIDYQEPETRAFVPAAEVKETETQFALSLEVPGFSLNDIKVEVDGNHLRVSGEKKTENKEDTEHYHFSEFKSGNFERTFHLPKTVDLENIQASHKDGLLTIAIPKAESSKPRLVEVKDGAKGLMKGFFSGNRQEKEAS